MFPKYEISKTALWIIITRKQVTTIFSIFLYSTLCLKRDLIFALGKSILYCYSFNQWSIMSRNLQQFLDHCQSTFREVTTQNGKSFVQQYSIIWMPIVI